MGETVQRVALATLTGGASETTRLVHGAGEKVVGKALDYVDEKTGAKAARDEQARIAQAALDAQNAQLEEAKAEKQAAKDAEAQLAEQQALKRSSLQRKRSSLGGRSGTILTSPLGAVGTFTAQRKTILGG